MDLVIGFADEEYQIYVGNIRFEAGENIELYARKNIMMEANAQMDAGVTTINEVR